MNFVAEPCRAGCGVERLTLLRGVGVIRTGACQYGSEYQHALDRLHHYMVGVETYRNGCHQIWPSCCSLRRSQGRSTRSARAGWTGSRPSEAWHRGPPAAGALGGTVAGRRATAPPGSTPEPHIGRISSRTCRMALRVVETYRWNAHPQPGQVAFPPPRRDLPRQRLRPRSHLRPGRGWILRVPR